MSMMVRRRRRHVPHGVVDLAGAYADAAALARWSFWAESPQMAALGLADTNPVVSLLDDGTENKDATQAVAGSRGTWDAAVPALNGKPGVQLDGVADFYTTAAWASSLAQPFWLLIVMSGVTGGNTVILDNDTGTDRIIMRRGNTGPLQELWMGTAYRGFTDTAQWCTLWYVNGAGTAYRDKDANIATVSATPGANALSGLTVGANRGGGAYSDDIVSKVMVVPGASWPQAEAFAYHDLVRSHYGFA